MVPVPGGMTRLVGTLNQAWAWSKFWIGTGWPLRALDAGNDPASL